MPRRKLPSPAEYGRRLAEAKRRQEKHRHEAQKRTETSFQRVLDQLERHMQSLETLESLVNSLNKEVLSPLTFDKVTAGVLRKLEDIQKAIETLDLEIPEQPVPEFPVEALDGVLSELRRLPETLKQPATPSLVSPQPAESILAGPVTLKVTGRDSNGDIDEVRVEPTRH